MRALRRALGQTGRRGFTLVELIVVIAIVGILAAVAIPVFVGYRREAGLSEARANLQGILEAQQAYFARFQRYTPPLDWCPPGPVPFLDPNGMPMKILWPKDDEIGTVCSAGWRMLGWSPDDAVAFRYRVFSAYNPAGDYANLPDDPASFPGLNGPHDRFGVDWGTEFGADRQPWCAVEAEADSDNDGNPVFLRSNSYNFKIYRHPNSDVDNGDTTY